MYVFARIFLWREPIPRISDTFQSISAIALPYSNDIITK
jgi:hypothetical protein